MYKKIILNLMLLPLFSSNALLCMDPATHYITHALMSIGTGVANAVTTKVIESYNPTQEQKVINTEAQERLNYIDKRTQYKNCLQNSKIDSEQTKHGVPVDCKKTMLEFILCGGENEVIAMTTNFNKYKD